MCVASNTDNGIRSLNTAKIAKQVEGKEVGSRGVASKVGEEDEFDGKRDKRGKDWVADVFCRCYVDRNRLARIDSRRKQGAEEENQAKHFARCGCAEDGRGGRGSIREGANIAYCYGNGAMSSGYMKGDG